MSFWTSSFFTRLTYVTAGAHVQGSLLAIALTAACARPAPETPAPAEAVQPKIGQWHRVTERTAGGTIDAEDAARLLALGYVEGSQAAPAQRDVTVHDRARAFQGVNLYVSGHASTAYLVDMDGKPLHTWSFPRERAFPGLARFAAELDKDRFYWRRVRLLPDGDLLAIYEGAGLIRIDAGSTLKWAHQGWNHHSVAVDGEGRFVTLGRHRREVPAVRAKAIIDGTVQVLSPDGRMLQEVSILDALMAGSEQQWRAELVDDEDALHTNAVVPLDASHAALGPAFAPGRVLVSIRELDRLAVIDLARGAAVATFRGGFRRQHEPVPLSGGKLLLFDNLGLGDRSRVMELTPSSGHVGWSYTGSVQQPFFTRTCGAAQRLANGNTLITESETGRAFEVTSAGDVVWELWNPHRAGPGNVFIAALFEVVRLPEQAWLTAPRRSPESAGSPAPPRRSAKPQPAAPPGSPRPPRPE